LASSAVSDLLLKEAIGQGMLRIAANHATYSAAACKQGYLNSKIRAHCNTQDAMQKSYGTREEHRISLKLFDAIRGGLLQELARARPGDERNFDFYYAIPSWALFGFLQTQINKYCLGFEYTLARTVNREVRWGETQLMILFLRALRLSYGGHQLGREPVIYRDTWTQKAKGNRLEQRKQGLGLKATIEESGIGWFLPKVDWVMWAVKPEPAKSILLENTYIQMQYRRRWQAVQGAANIFTLIREA
jgi:hypothetical protein